MPHELLDYSRRNASLIGQRRQLAPQGVEVEILASAIDVRDAGGGQVGLEHVRSRLGQREDGHLRIQRSHVDSQVVRQIARQGQLGFLTVLGVASGHANAGDLPIERAGQDAADLRETQAGRNGQSIAQRSHRAGHGLIGGALLGNRDEPLQFIEGDGPPIVATIFLGIEPGQANQGLIPQPSRPPTPSSKGADAGSIMVACLGRTSRLAERCQCGLNPLGSNVR